MILLLYKEIIHLMFGLSPFAQCRYTQINNVFACPHWPSANNDPKHHMAFQYIYVFTFGFEINRCQALTY